MTQFLVEFSRDWADEFQAEGLAIMTSEQFDKLIAWAKKGPETYFGTNEGWECEDLSDSYTAREITDEEAEVLKRLIPDLGTNYSWQTFASFGQFPEGFDEDEGSEEDEE
jgi:hypothetical protein